MEVKRGMKEGLKAETCVSAVLSAEAAKREEGRAKICSFYPPVCDHCVVAKTVGKACDKGM